MRRFEDMNPLTELLATNEVILLDGAMGTMLIQSGLVQGESPDLWNVEHPEKVKNVHRAYIEAGSRLVLTNTFGGTSIRLKYHNLQDRAQELNRAAAENLREVVDAVSYPVIAAGSMGPTGEMMKPMGPLTFEEAKAAFSEQAQALAAGGVDVIWIETMSDLNETKAAIEGAREVCDLPITTTMTFDTNGFTMMGVSPEQALEALRVYDLAAIGANCGNGPLEIEDAIEKMHSLDPDAVLIAKANAGIPKMVQGEVTYDGTPEIMADYAQRVRTLGARLIGTCCGSSPDHIRAMADALEISNPN
jgi:5-methyltetrahydrofolate--homocysteine methyltransferase